MADTGTHAGTSARGPIGSFALKHDEIFLVADVLGDIEGGADGLFRDDTRVLSLFRLSIGGAPPSLLGSGVSRDNVFFRANLTNRPLPQLGNHATPEGVIHVERSRLLWEERLYERLTLTNYGERAVPAALAFAFDADFADIFEVRGHRRTACGRRLPPEIAGDRVLMRYAGRDERVRTSSIAFSRPPDKLDAQRAEFSMLLQRHARLTLYLEVGPAHDGVPGEARFRNAAALARVCMRRRRRRGASLQTSSGVFNVWIDKSRADLALLETDLATGPYPFAGIPWFSTPFGRDAIVTALQTLWLDPTLARGVLAFLALHQAREVSAFSDSAPGKILHEMRKSEMCALGEVPFAKYYGGVDTTPLFVMLAGAYAQRTGDLAFIEALWPALEAAMAWIEGPGDSNQDGFLDYERGEATGLANQGWKDSVDSIFHADGRLPRGPIALLEVQGYVYAARLAMAELAGHRGDGAMQDRWLERAQRLRVAVEERFWMPEEEFYAIAIDGEGALCRVRASNAGHLLYTGLPSEQRAAHVSRQLLSATFDNGWGLRTVSDHAPRFNPMSYHNGSVWPHDTGLCAAGIGRYGDRSGITQLLNETFGAAQHFGMRLPELFCGFARAAGEPPVGYPVACLPQAWSSGAIFMMLQACLGLRIDGWRREIHIDRPALPPGIERLTVRDLEVGDERVELQFQRIDDHVAASSVGRAPETVRVLVRES